MMSEAFAFGGLEVSETHADLEGVDDATGSRLDGRQVERLKRPRQVDHAYSNTRPRLGSLGRGGMNFFGGGGGKFVHAGLVPIRSTLKTMPSRVA